MITFFFKKKRTTAVVCIIWAVDSQSSDSSFDAQTIRQFLLVLLDLFLRNKLFSILQFLGSHLLGFSLKSLFLMSNSPYKLILSL